MSNIEISDGQYGIRKLRNPTTINGAYNNEIYLKVNNVIANTTVPSNGERAVLKKTGSSGVGEPDSNGKYHIIEYLQKFTENVDGVDVNFLGEEKQDANGKKYYKINKINDDNSKNISVTESDGDGGSSSGPPHFNYIEEWQNHDGTTTGLLKKEPGNPTYEYTQHNGKPGIMGYGWHHSLQIQNVDRPAATVMVLDKIVEGNDDGIWKWFIRVNQGWWHNAATHAYGWYGRYMLDNHNDGRLVNYGGYNDGPYLPNPNDSTRDGTNGFGYGAYNMNYFTNKTVGYHNEHVKDRYAPIPHSISSEERAGSVMVLYSPEACPDGYDHTKIHMVGNTLNEIKVHLRNPKPGKRIYFFRGGWNQGNCNFELEFGNNYGSAGYVDQQYKSIWHEIILFGSSLQNHDQNYYIGTGGSVNQFTNNDSLQSTAAQLHGLTTLVDPNGDTWGATTLQNPSSKNCDSYGYIKTTLLKVLNDKWGVNSNIQRETLANGKGPLLNGNGDPSTSYSAPDPNKTDIENGIDQFNQWKAVWIDPSGIQIRAHLDAGKMPTRTNAQRYIYPNSYISVDEDANTVTFYTSIFEDPTIISDSDNSALINGLGSISTNNLNSGKSNKILSSSIINKIKELIIDAVISSIGAKIEKRRKTFKQIINNSSSNVVQIDNNNTYFKDLFTDKLKSNITTVKVFKNNQTIILSGSNTDVNSNESFYTPLDNNEYTQIKIDDSNEIKITRADDSNGEHYQLEIINGTPDIFKIGNTATNLNIDANNKYVNGYLVPNDIIVVHNRKLIIGSVTDGGAVTRAEFTNITPTANSVVNTTGIGYTLNATLTTGTITFTHTGGVADSNSPHTVQLTGNELDSGVRSLAALTNAPSLVSGAIYSITFSGSNDDGPVHPEPTIQNITFDNTAPNIINLQPAQDTFISSANIGYELSENLASGKVKFINTSDSTEEEVDLTGTELNSGVRSLAALTNAPTLTHGKTYTIEINGSDAAGNVAATASVTGLKYEVPTSELDSLTIPELYSFSFNSTTENYNLTYNGDSINVTYQAKSNNVTITVEDANSNDISSNLSPLTLSNGDNVVKIIVASNFSGTAAKTYTVTVNKPSAVDKVNNSLAAAGLDSPAVGSADETAVNSLSSADANSFYSSNDTVSELPNSVKTAIQGVATNPTKVKALMQKILLECANNSKTIDIDKPIELPIDTFSFATANLPANPPAKISVIPPSSQAISLDTSTNAIYVPLSVGEQMDFKLTYPTVTDNTLPHTQTITNYNIKFFSITDTQFTFTLPAGLEAYTTVDGAAYNSSNHSTLNNGAVVNINGNVIIIGSVLFGGNDGSGTSDPYSISSADQAVLTTGLDAISEETGRGNLKIKPLNATMNAKLKELIVDSSDSTEVKRKKRDNALYIILNHANMGSSTAIKVPKSDLGFTEMSENALNVVVFKTSSSATVLDITGLNNDEAFYAPLSKNSQFSIDLGGGSVPTFVRADEVTEKYTLTVTGTPKLIKKTGCNDLILDSNNHLVGGHLVSGDVVQIANRIFFMGMLGDGGQSIILEYANVAWTNVYDPNTTSFEDNIAAANPTVPLQPYNREITIDGIVIPAGELKFVKFGNGSTTVNFSN